MKQAFAIYDSDGSNTICSHELADLMNEVCDMVEVPHLKKCQLNECFDILDSNKDGKITLKEIMKHIKHVSHVILHPSECGLDIEENYDNNSPYHKQNVNFIQALGKKMTLIEKIKKEEQEKEEAALPKPKRKQDKTLVQGQSTVELPNADCLTT